LLLVLLLAGATEAGATPALKVGDRAPKVQVGKWLQGEPVKEFKKGKAYVIEFWATWCAPCLISIPHLSELQTRFKDKGLVVIGVNCDGDDESKVPDFVKKMGDKMNYRVALDDKAGSENGKMIDSWLVASDQEVIPTAFVVGPKGNVVWIGSPLALDDQIIEKALAGKSIKGQVAGK
jgi:thiol-disulfide isomerase/thioredoxin